jgi:hypothetical protein
MRGIVTRLLMPCRGGLGAPRRQLLAAAALAACAAAVPAPSAVAASPRALRQTTIHVPIPSAGDLTFATYSVTNARARSRAADAGPTATLAALAIPADVTATAALARTAVNTTVVTVAIARRVLTTGKTAAAAGQTLAVNLKYRSGTVLRLKQAFLSRNTFAGERPLDLPSRCAANLSNPFVNLPTALLMRPNRYVHPFPGLAASDFQQNAWNATCWRPLSPSFYAYLEAQPPLVITVTPQRVGNDNTIRFSSNLPLMDAGVWVPPGDPIINVAAQPGLMFQPVNSMTGSWLPNTYAWVGGPLAANTDYSIAYESPSSDAGRPSQFTKVALFPPNGTAVMGTTAQVP